MKHLFPLTIIIAALFAGCSAQPKDTREFNIAATFYPVYLAAANIADGADNVSVSLLTQPTVGCLHEYQLTPGELKNAESASVVFASGTELFLDRITSPVYDCGGGKGEHFWVLPENFIEMSASICTYLQQADPANAELYLSNYNAYYAELSALAEELKNGTDKLNRLPVITFHEAFGLWGDAYGLDIAASVEREPGTEPTPRELAETIDLVRELDIRALFAEPQYSDTAVKVIARETGATVYTLDPVASGPMELDYYQTAQRENLETLRLALGEK